MAKITFTVHERTVKKFPVEFAIKQAAAVLDDKYKLKGVSINTVTRIDESILFTTEEINNLVEGIIDDTLYYEGHFHGAGKNATSRH